GVLARLQHAGHPVERGIHVRAPHGFDEGADDVVVLLAPLVVEQRLLLQRLLRGLPVHLRAPIGGSHLQRGEGLARIPSGCLGDELKGLVVHLHLAAQPLGGHHRPAQHAHQFLFFQPAQGDDTGA
ncbi:hypothetical protein STIAU_6310, partial [Stigmatella aurantiaca DW4/3-1]